MNNTVYGTFQKIFSSKGNATKGNNISTMIIPILEEISFIPIIVPSVIIFSMYPFSEKEVPPPLITKVTKDKTMKETQVCNPFISANERVTEIIRTTNPIIPKLSDKKPTCGNAYSILGAPIFLSPIKRTRLKYN